MANPKKGRGADRGSRSPIRVSDVAMPRDREKPGSVVLPGLAMAAGIILFVFLLRFAIDLLIWVLVLALFAVVLHVIMVWLAHSELLTAPWLFIIFLIVGALTWMFWPGSSFQEGLSVTSFLPAPIVEAIKSAEERGLTRRVFVPAPAAAGGAEQPAGTGVPSPRSEPVTMGGGAATLSVSIALTGTTASRVGEPVTLVATVGTRGRSSAQLAGTVQFLDDSVLLGEAVLLPVGNSRRASLTVSGLSAGTHRITASYAGAASSALVHTVAGS
jgi:Bacterial Ig-like domain (group 3)